MHSFGYRANALLTFALTILALICAMASFSDNLNSPSPSAHVQVSLTLNVSANLQSLFTWNTKQVFVFLAAEYETPKNSLNQGSNLRGREYNLTLHWHVMPKTGKMFADKLVMSGFRFPEEYR
ncbi:hypothetical protein RHGRI_021270 [Rhododendron griersonianum]|uniref:Signal peptidase complex subunit 3 n=1 Tax=Rhododendron griersonianum TaxID=479676 RepID=A0AAV6JJL5_9ERIC|nr:hypothetical protein RHGRI_021270 [Rhododendron griersonianum]